MSRSIVRPAIAAVAASALLLVGIVPAAQAALPANQAEYLVDGATRQGAYNGNVSDDGSKVLFTVDPDNYPGLGVPADTFAFYSFVRDVTTNEVKAVGVDAVGNVPDGLYFPSLSNDGRYVSYWTYAAGITQVYRWDVQTKANVLVSVNTVGGPGNNGGTGTPSGSGNPSISSTGRFVSFVSSSDDLIVGDTNGVSDLFVRDLVNNTTTRVLENFGNADLEHQISGDGSTIGIITDANGRIPSDTNSKFDVYTINVATKAITLVSAIPAGGIGTGSVGYYPGLELSTDGSIVMFESWAADLVAGDNNAAGDVFVRNVTAGTTALAAKNPGTGWPNAGTFESDLSADGRFVSFLSTATNLDAPGVAGQTSVFLRDLLTSKTVRVGTAGFNGGSAASSSYSSVSSTGQYVAFYNTNGTASAVILRNLAPVITAGSAPTNVAFNSAYSFAVTATGVDQTFPLTFSTSAGSLPGGLSLNPTTGVISGTTTASGEFSFSITATNAVGAATKAFTITVNDGPPPAPDVVRVSGTNRYDTAVKISQASFPMDGSADVVYVATGANYPDALAAAAAAANRNGPLLLTSASAVPADVLAEIQRLDPANIVVVGGEASVSTAAYNQLAALPGDITRTSGANRYATSRAIVSEAFPTGASGAYVSTGRNFPDALSAGGVAGANSEPVVLVDGLAASADSETVSLLTALGVDDIRISGGTSSVSTGIETSLGSVAPVSRISGSNRYAVSQSINERFVSSDIVLLATGVNFPDALTGATWAGNAEAPLYIVNGSCVPAGVLAEIERLGATEVYLLGGTSTLGAGVESLTSCG